MSEVGFEPTIPMFGRQKVVYNLESSRRCDNKRLLLFYVSMVTSDLLYFIPTDILYQIKEDEGGKV
jgi:hypothetical protein